MNFSVLDENIVLLFGVLILIICIGGMRMNATSADNRTSSLVLIISFCVFILSLFLMRWDVLAEANYNVHEMTGVVFGLGFYVLPIESIVWFFYWRRHIKSKVQSAVTIRILNIAALLLAFIGIALPVIGITTEKTSGSAMEIDKYSSAEQYYVSLDYRSIRVSKDTYDEIEDGFIQGVAYSFEYTYNDLFLGRNNVFWLEIDKIKF